MSESTDMHSCSYYCDRPDCVRQQRDELRDRLEALAEQNAEIERLRAGLLAVIAADQVYGHRAPHNGPGWHDGELAEIARRYLTPNAEFRRGEPKASPSPGTKG